MSYDTHELAWAAGLFDGEGSAGAGNGIVLQVAQKDRRVLDRFCAAVGVGKVRGPYGKGQMFNYAANSFENVQAVACLLWRWLSPVKREQITRAVRKFAENHRRTGAKKRSVCVHGHRLWGWNLTIVAGKRRCRACTNRRAREAYHRKKAAA